MIGFFARHPTAANLLMLILLALGIVSLPQLRRETFPDITPFEVEVKVPYPGATAEEVEEVICQRVEDAVDGVKFIKEVRADAREGVAIVTIEMEDGGDFAAFKDDITSEVDAIDDFPNDVDDPVITQLGTTDLVVTLAVSGRMTTADLKAWCEAVKDRLQRLPEVSLVKVAGFSDHQLRVELSAEALKRYGLSVGDVADVISRQSVNVPAGAIETRDQDILIRFVEERRAPVEFEDLVIKGRTGGAEVRLSEVARIIDTFEVDEDKVLLGRERAGLLHIEKTKNQDIIRVAAAVKEFVARERERHPQVTLAITRDESTLVVDRLQMLTKNGIQGIVLVFLTLWLFFNAKLSFWVAMSLPVSFFGAFFFMPPLDLTINMMTMVGLLLALGLLMDDGIVIAENIASHRARGKSGMQAAVDGVGEVKAGVFSSFLTTVCVLGPAMMITGDIGKVLKVIPMILIVVMAVSLIEAFAILPAHLGHSMHGDLKTPGRFRQLFDRGIDWTREVLFGRAVDRLLDWRYLWIGSVVGVFLISVGLMVGGVVKFQAFPDLDGNALVARLLLPGGTPLSRTEEVVGRVTAALDRVNDKFAPRQPGGEDLVQTVNVEFNKNTDSFESGPHVATINVDLLNAETRNARIDDIIQAWNDEVGRLPDVMNLSIGEPGFGPAGRPIEVRLQGQDFDTLKAAASETVAWLDRFQGVRNLTEDLRPGKPELRLRLRDGALGLGLDAANMASQLRHAFSGVTADEIQVGPESYEIDVRLSPNEQDSLADLEYFQFVLRNGDRVPIDAVAEVQPARGWSRIARINGVRTVTIRGDIDSRVTKATSLTNLMQTEFVPQLQQRHPEVAVSFEGEVKEGNNTSASMMKALIIGLLGVFVLLSFQFRSYIEPLVVMLAIPLSLIGVIWGHLIVGIDISMPSLLGFVSLSGVVVNDSILLVLFLKNRIDEGSNILQAAAQASRQRFRAILLTSLTTIAGLLPLLFERSLQAQIIIPLAVSIAFGMMASTVLVLLVIPCFYAVLSDFGLIHKTVAEHE